MEQTTTTYDPSVHSYNALPAPVLLSAIAVNASKASSKLGSVSSPLCVWKLERICSQTQLYQLRRFNDYTRQLHVSAPTGHLQVVFNIIYIVGP